MLGVATTPQFDPNGRFAAVAAHVLGLEGGYVDNKADHGGATKYGISLRFLAAEGKLDRNHDGFKDYDLDFDGDIDGADIRLLTRDQALELYYECFWRRLLLDRLPLHIDAAVFDQAVNGGAKAAVRMLQTSLNRLHVAPGDLKDDGDLGNQTIARAWTAERIRPSDLLIAYRQAAEARYNGIVRADHRQVVFLDGWVARARRLGDV